MTELKDNFNVNASVPSLVDKKGNTVVLSSPLNWSTDNTDVLALTPSADGLSCLISAIGPIGVATVTAKATSDSGDITGTVQISVIPSAPTAVKIVLDTPVEQTS